MARRLICTIALLAAWGSLGVWAQHRDAALAAQPLGGEEPMSKTSDAKPKPQGQADKNLIPRQVLFGNPDKARARLSPDGKRVAFLAPVDGVLNVWVGSIDNPEAAKAVTRDTKRGIRTFYWAYTNKHVVYRQDQNGDENWHVYSVDLDNDKTTDLTPLENVAAQLEGLSHRQPGALLVNLNDRDPQFHDVYRIDIATGQRKLIQKNPGFAGFVTDDDFRVRFATRFEPDGSNQLFQPDGAGGWKKFINIPQSDTLTTSPIGFDKSGETLYMLDSRGRDTGALAALNLKTNKETILAASDKADINGVISHPTENTILAASYEYTRKVWEILDDSIQPDFTYLRSVADGDIEVTSQSLDDKFWIVAYLMDNGPIRYYHYDRGAKQAKFLFSSRKDLEDLPLVKMRPEVITASDGLKMVSYLSLPKDADTDGDARPERPLPMVLMVHGGPWARDDWGFDSYHQWLANRGYAVLSVNFRGSTGFGKAFLNAGAKKWGTRMQQDLTDAVAWAVKGKIADPQRVAIMGGSYGGYATLAGLTMTPNEFACGVDIVGPSNLLTLLATIPPYWKPVLQMFKDRVGDPDTPEGRELLKERSPLTYVDRIVRPLLIGQGANDPRVKQAESDQIVEAMQAKRIPVTYVLYPDEGHGFARPANRLSFNAVAEAFLAEHLGGKYQPIGDDFSGSTIKIPQGADQVPGVEAALKRQSDEKK